ncbi:protein LDOC1-like [Ascaphus truei]|uniref:protein LDOC1-like n=1 Tax=Ascaphus truei TaxID=8439 RepID=UPI003F5A3890
MQSPTDADQIETDEPTLDQILSALIVQNQTMSTQISDLAQRLTNLSLQGAPPSVSSQSEPGSLGAATPETKIPAPKPYAGDPQACRGFLNQCEVQFEMAPLHQFTTGRKKVAYVYSLFTGGALVWASPIWELRPKITQDYALFRQEFQQVFDTPARQDTASSSLLLL